MQSTTHNAPNAMGDTTPTRCKRCEGAHSVSAIHESQRAARNCLFETLIAPGGNSKSRPEVEGGSDYTTLDCTQYSCPATGLVRAPKLYFAPVSLRVDEFSQTPLGWSCDGNGLAALGLVPFDSVPGLVVREQGCYPRKSANLPAVVP